MRHKRARPKERPILSFLLNPFGLGFPRPGQPVRGEGCPRAHGHPSGDIQAVTNPWPPWRAPCAVGLCPAGWRGSSHCGSLSLGETAQDGPGRRPARGRSVWDGGARPRMEDISAVPSAKPQKQPSPPNSQHQPTRRPPRAGAQHGHHRVSAVQLRTGQSLQVEAGDSPRRASGSGWGVGGPVRTPLRAQRRPLELAWAPVLEEGDASLRQPSPEESPGCRLWAAGYPDPTCRRLPGRRGPGWSSPPAAGRKCPQCH